MRLMNLGLMTQGFEMATTDATDTAGDNFLADVQKDAAMPKRPFERKVGDVVPVRRPQHWAAAARFNPRDEITQEHPFEAEVVAARAVAVPVAPITPTILPPAVIGTTGLQLDVRATVIKKFGKAILVNFGVTTGIYGQPVEQKPTPGRLKVDIQTGQLATSKRPATGPTVEIQILINPFHNRVNLNPEQRVSFAIFAASGADTAPLYQSILALDGMAILGHPSDVVDPTLTEVTRAELINVNKTTLSVLVEVAAAMTIDLSEAEMMDAKNVRIYFAPDGSICRADAKTAGFEFGSTYSKGLAQSPHYLDVAISGNTILAYGELSHLMPRQLNAFWALYGDSEMVNRREAVEKESPGLGQRVMEKAVH